MAAKVIVARDGPVAIITLNNPGALNAFDLPMAAELAVVVEAAAADGAVRALLVRGAGKHFCAGGDLAAISGAADPSAYTLELARTANRILESFRTMPKPVIAEMRGAVAGGGVGVALAADLRIASDNAKLSLAFHKVGLSPDMGSTWTLPRLVGRGRAFELASSSAPLTIMEAWRLGLVNRVVNDAELETEGLKWAHELAALAPLAVQEVKALLNAAPSNTFTEHIGRDSAAIARMAGTDDFKEGARAFFEKRPPKFEGK